jgi:hypothetical protein
MEPPGSMSSVVEAGRGGGIEAGATGRPGCVPGGIVVLVVVGGRVLDVEVVEVVEVVLVVVVVVLWTHSKMAL